MSELRERSSKLYHTNHQIPAHKSNELSVYEKQLEILKDIEKKTEKPLNNIIHVHNQLRKRYYPAASENAEDRRRKRRVKENKQKSKKRKQETLVRNGQELASFLTGSAAEDSFSVPNPSKIRKAELTVLNTKTLIPRKHLEPLKYLLENNYFHEDTRECILSILSVLEVRKVQTKASAKQEKKLKNTKKHPQRANIPIWYFQNKKIWEWKTWWRK